VTLAPRLASGDAKRILAGSTLSELGVLALHAVFEHVVGLPGSGDGQLRVGGNRATPVRRARGVDLVEYRPALVGADGCAETADSAVS